VTGRYEIAFPFGDTTTVDPWASGLLTSIVPVIFRRAGEQVFGQGTAFCVTALVNGEAIFVTAKHVIDELRHNPEIEPFILLPRGLGNDADRRSLVGVRVQGISLAESYSDVALMVINVRESGLPVTTELKMQEITFGQPRLGDPCLALGYPQQLGPVSYTLQGSRGLIEEIHPRQRDRSLSTFPSFRTTGLFVPGMSGGPIIDTGGRVVGVISHGTDALESGSAIGYGASVAAISELKLDLHVDDGQVHEFTIQELVDMGALGRGSDSYVTLERRGDGITLIWDRDAPPPQ